MPRLEAKSLSPAARRLLQTACRMFAERGVDGVTVREIAEAAGQKNHAAVGYHFGSKEALIRRLILEGAVLIDGHRNQALDALEASGRPITVRDIVEVLIRSSIELEGSGLEDCYCRFLITLRSTYHELFMDTLAGRWNSGYQRCLTPLRAVMPDMPAEVKNERFVFMEVFLGGVLAAREAALADQSRHHPTWSSDQTLVHFATAMTAMLEAPQPK